MVALSELEPLDPSTDKSHHVGNPPSSFQNPWPSFPSQHASFPSVLKARFFDKRPPFVPVPTDRAGLVPIHRPDFTAPLTSSPSSPSSSGFNGFRVTWIGHASFLLQCCSPDLPRPLSILLDPVFAERTSPVTFIGPKRYTPTPCTLQELLDAVPVDLVCVSHNHYDHADTTALKAIHEHRKAHNENVVFCVALGNARWLLPLGIPKEQIWEADWWDRKGISLSSSADMSTAKEKVDNAQLKITCTPSQHTSARSPFDRDRDLWCSWAFELPSALSLSTPDAGAAQSPPPTRKSLFFAGDTGYRTVPALSPDQSEADVLGSLSTCSAFKQIGKHLGPFDMALLPIGLCRPRQFMSSVHCNSTDSMDIFFDIRARRAVGMHWGTVRGGISAYWEDVKDPPKEWQQEAAKHRLRWRGDAPEDWQAGLMDIGESLLV